MAYNNIVSRSDAQALIPEVVSNELITGLQNRSAALTLMRRIPMSTAQTRFPVLAALPTAYFVNGDTGLKQTTEVDWTNKYINVEELAAIVPIPEAVLDDVAFDMWGAIRPLLEDAIARVLDAAIFFGANKPASWPTDVNAATVAAGNVISRGTAAQAAGGIAQDVNALMATVEGDGFGVNGFVTRATYKSLLRGARDTTGQKLLDVSANSIEGAPLSYAMAGLWPSGSGSAEMFAGDWAQFILGVRQDFTYKLLDQAVITDNTGAIVYNLAQQDMVALRVVFRVGWQVANFINYENTTEATRYPAAVMHAP